MMKENNEAFFIAKHVTLILDKFSNGYNMLCDQITPIVNGQFEDLFPLWQHFRVSIP